MSRRRPAPGLPKVPAGQVTDLVRHTIDLHDRWDAFHEFDTLHWDGTQVTVGTVVKIDPAVYPPDYLAFMSRAAHQDMHDAGIRPCGFLLQIETWAMEVPAPGSSAAYRHRYDRARMSGTFHEQPDAFELCYVWCADLHGRMWQAVKQRNLPGQADVRFYPAGDTSRPSGPMIRMLDTVALAAATVR